ncbi:hypothetical protein YK56LOC_36010 [Caballeronia sp. HLA56]
MSAEETAGLVTLHAVTNGVAQIVIDRPGRHNAMTIPMYRTLVELLERCERSEVVRCITLRGAGGKSFVSGTDIDYFRDFTSGEQGVAYEAMHRVSACRLQRRSPTPCRRATSRGSWPLSARHASRRC